MPRMRGGIEDLDIIREAETIFGVIYGVAETSLKNNYSLKSIWLILRVLENKELTYRKLLNESTLTDKTFLRYRRLLLKYRFIDKNGNIHRITEKGRSILNLFRKLQ